MKPIPPKQSTTRRPPPTMNQRTRNVIGNASFFFVEPPISSTVRLDHTSTDFTSSHHHDHYHPTELPKPMPRQRRRPRTKETIETATTEGSVSVSAAFRSPRGLAVSKELSQLLRNWDKGSALTRRGILRHFISEHNSETASEIEASYANGGSLLLSRLISTLRVTKSSLSDTVLHFRAMKVFLSSSSGAPYLAEFLEAGGINVTLSALGSIISPSNPDMPRAKYLSTSASELCQSTFELLRLIAVAGRPYKELLCECDVLVQIASIMCGSMNSAINHDGRTLLLELGSGNPMYEESVLYTVLQMLPCPNPVCQRMAAQITRAFMSTLSFHASKGGYDAALSFVPAAVSMTKSVDLQVQYEAVELLSVLSRDCPATIPAIVAGLLPLARNPVLDKEVCRQATSEDPPPLTEKEQEDKNKEKAVNDEKEAKEKKKSNGSKKVFNYRQDKDKIKIAPKVEDAIDEEAEARLRNYEQILAVANSWQSSATRALESLVTIAGASRAITRQGGVYILLGALLNDKNVDARDVALESLIALCKSEETIAAGTDDDSSRSRSSRSLRSLRSRRKSNGATVGNTTQLAVAHVLGEKQWNLLRGMSTTVGQTIENVEECCNRIRESSGATTTIDLDASDVKSIVQNLFACRMITTHLASNAIKISSSKAENSKRRALSTHVGPETKIEGDDNEYRELMERLIRSSLPEIMDRDFTQGAESALKQRNKDRR